MNERTPLFKAWEEFKRMISEEHVSGSYKTREEECAFLDGMQKTFERVEKFIGIREIK